jgi:hypothetical protein
MTNFRHFAKIMTQIVYSITQIFVCASIDVSNFAKRKSALINILKFIKKQTPEA